MLALCVLAGWSFVDIQTRPLLHEKLHPISSGTSFEIDAGVPVNRLGVIRGEELQPRTGQCDGSSLNGLDTILGEQCDGSPQRQTTQRERSPLNVSPTDEQHESAQGRSLLDELDSMGDNGNSKQLQQPQQPEMSAPPDTHQPLPPLAPNSHLFIQQWNICPQHNLQHEQDEALDLAAAAEAHASGHSDPSTPTCMSFASSAHSVGLSADSRLVFSLSKKQLNMLNVPPKMQAWFPRPWHLQMVIKEVRYDRAAGGFRLLYVLDFVQVRLQHRDSIGGWFYYPNELYGSFFTRLAAWLVPLTCERPHLRPLHCHYEVDATHGKQRDQAQGHSVHSFHSPRSGLESAEGVGGVSHFEAFCAYPYAPQLPPQRLQLNLYFSAAGLQAIGEQPYPWSRPRPGLPLHAEPDLRLSAATVPICARNSRLVSTVYCGRLFNPVYHASLGEFIEHHLYHGIEHFDFSDQFGLHRKLLQPLVDAGFGSYRRNKDFAAMWVNGNPTHVALWSSTCHCLRNQVE